MEANSQTTLPRPANPYTRRQWMQFFLFWSWNLVFVAFMLFGFAPVLLPETLTGVRAGFIPAGYLAYALILALIPVGCLILGLTVLRRAPERLFALGYVIEGPLMLILAVRFFAIRQATPAVFLALAIALFGMGAFLWTLLDRRAGERNPWLEGLRLAGLTLMAITSLYAAAWIAFYALPLAVEGLRGVSDFLADLPARLRGLWRSLIDLLTNSPMLFPLSVLGFILLLYTATLFVLTPIVVPVLSLRAWWRELSGQAARHGWLRPAMLVVAVLAASAGLFAAANRQPQARAFALLEQPPASAQAASELLDQSETIRAGLLNAYLAPFRYISAQGEVRHVADIYENTFKIPRQQAYAVERLYEGLASPLLYRPVHPQQFSTWMDNRALAAEPQEAARLYQRFFDVPITDGERPSIVNAARSTWSANQAEAAWQAVDDREVFLVSQELAVQEHGDWAELELHEAYQNQTGQQQEVVYYFSLPESAVITGVWLGATADKSEAYAYQVAPRGAAQAVYREETRVMRDPALVEQIGPRQYRLRVYPVPGLGMDYDQRTSRTRISAAPQLHVWLTWQEMAAPEGWPLPKLAMLRNVYWDGDTQRSANGQPLDIPGSTSETGAPGRGWLPEFLPASGDTTPQTHRVDLPGDQTVLAQPAAQAALPDLPQGARLAVVIDRSRSMQDNATRVIEALESLEPYNTPETPVDIYLTASPFRGEEPSVVKLSDLDAGTILYFGGQNPAELIAQFETLRGDQTYDAVLVLSDGSGYELGQGEQPLAVPDAPLWMIHLGDDLPLGYDDQTLQAIQASGGGVTGDVQTALDRLAVFLSARSDPGQDAGADSQQAGLPSADLVDGYLWISLPTAQAGSTAANKGLEPQPSEAEFAALGARRLILAEMERNQGSIQELETLDYLHALATQYGIVTPYSSMIVLVEARQQALLDKLSNLEDRYQREVEALGDTTPASPVPLAGVPEPEEWLLMGLAAAILIYYVYTKKRPAWASVSRIR